MDIQYNQKFTDEFSLKHKITRSNELPRPHYHDDYELFLNLTENLVTMVNGKYYHINPGTLLLFNNMDLHHNYIVSNKNDYDRYVLFFKPDYIRSLSSAQTDLLECFLFRPFEDPNILPLSRRQQDKLIKTMNQIININHAQSDEIYGKDLLIKFKLGELLINVNSIYREYHGIKHTILNSHYSLVYNIINFIHANFQNNLSLDYLEKKFYINKYYLCTLFKEVTGTSPNQYIINCRINKAKELLMNDVSVEETCSQSGFNNLSHFSRTFKKAVGDSPKQFQLKSKSIL
ncbi:MAG: AraC family transcriptional regulator [Lachnospiraceae bacterium]|nr:AraC family transcriptional regulator [Lachnospiraceae bacterium]